MELSYQYQQIINQSLDYVSDLEEEDLIEIFGEFKKGKSEKKITLDAFLKFLRIEYGAQTQKTIKKKKTSYSISSLPKNLMCSTNAQNTELILAAGLKKEIGARTLLSSSSFSVHTNTQVAVVWPNGAGKSTLLKILGKKDDQFDGEVTWGKNVKIGFLSQDLVVSGSSETLRDYMLKTLPEIGKLIHELDDIHTYFATHEQITDEILYARQNIIMDELSRQDGYKKYALQTDLLKYFWFCDEQLDFPISQLSGGEMMRIQIAQFILQEVDLLILDEPTNHLDIEGIIFLEEFLKKWRKGIICVSHDKKFINTVFSMLWEINDGKLSLYKGNYSTYEYERERRFDETLQIYEQQQEFIKKQEDFIRKWAGKPTKSGMVESRKKMIARIDQIEKPISQKTTKGLTLETKEYLPDLFFRTEKLVIGYPNSDTIVTINDLEVHKGGSFGIIGKNGCGKTTFLKTLMNKLDPLEGTIYTNPSIKIGYFSQISDELNPENTILDEIQGKTQENEKKIRALLGNLLITGDKVFDKIKTLSGGERSKVALAIIVLQRPQLILLDEPTNHLDIPSKNTVREMLANFSGVSIIVSHDRDFLEGLVEEIFLIKDGEWEMFENIPLAFNRILDNE